MKKPIRKIPYSRQSIDASDVQAVTKVLRSGYVTQGPTVKEFEENLAQYVGAKYAVAFSSGTAALQAAYFAAGIRPGDEIITTPLTFAATANAALWLSARVVFADIESSTMTLDPAEVERKITKKTKAIVPVDYSGSPSKLDELRKIAKKYKLILIEDAAHALGAEYKGKKVGSLADMTMFSFHPVKSITTGEGGAITTDDTKLFERLQLFRNHGITKDPRRFIRKAEGAWYHEMHELGLNYRMPDILAALGVSQLKKIERFMTARRRIAARYQKELSGNAACIIPQELPGSHSSWHLFPLRLANARKRAHVFQELQRVGIGVQVHYIPVYWHPFYQKLGYKKGLCPNAEAFYQSEISLPLFPDLSQRDQGFVIQTINRLL